ncbi:IS66 family insertion sequence element accessory protein TnpA, partial [Thiolapillus sp.]|uniref:IS66 family insertion sequence element accessory protein TnpA n=1 Tax=Thiolapillus sp. TaxID=2017437 RepID=UPI003AF4F232
MRPWSLPRTNRLRFALHGGQRMDMSDATEGAPFWQLHIAAWQQSGLTQKAYCEHQELRYST